MIRSLLVFICAVIFLLSLAAENYGMVIACMAIVEAAVITKE